MSTVQMNVRIDNALKESGDRVLALMGYSPTRAVRALWQFLASNAGDEKVLRDMLARLEGAGGERVRGERLELAARGAGLADRLLEQHGLELRAEYVPLTKSEARDDALRERFERKGLL